MLAKRFLWDSIAISVCQMGARPEIPILNFFPLSCAPASDGFLAQAVGTCKGSPLCSDRAAAPAAALTEPSSPLPSRKEP